MTILRFMSAHEAIRLLNGETLERDTDHAGNGFKSTSRGFCFAIADGNWLAAIYDAATRLSGIVIMDTCLVATLKEHPAHTFVMTKGHYRGGMTDEISTVEYDLNDFDDWKLYTPELPPVASPFKVISSINWQDAVLTRSSE
jgi:hypothetical protein